MEDNTTLILLGILLLTAINLIVMMMRKPQEYGPEFRGLETRLDQSNHQFDKQLRDEFAQNRMGLSQNASDLQNLIISQLDMFGNHQGKWIGTFQNQITGLIESNQLRFHELTESITKSLHDVRFDVNGRLESIQKDNHTQLEKMRETVDEKLHKTLEERLGKSFELVSQHLEAVQKGLGEMQHLAAGVGDLKKVLSNVKTRGVMGEVQLGNILEQMLTKDQYGVNVSTIPNSRNHVEFAIKFPGKDDEFVWLPIDAKFPLDRYHQLVDAYEDTDIEKIEAAKKQLKTTIKSMAKDIRDKYIAPPHTTDFGMLFLPIEGLYAEVVRETGLMEELQRDYKIMIAGPTNLAAFINSLQMGFRSIAIEKRSSEVWKVLGAVKTEFGKFGVALDHVHKKLEQASTKIHDVGVRSRAIERKLKDVETLPSGGPAIKELPFDDGLDIEDFTTVPVLES